MGFKYKFPTPLSPKLSPFLTKTLHRVEYTESFSTTALNSTFGGSSSASSSFSFDLSAIYSALNAEWMYLSVNYLSPFWAPLPNHPSKD